MTTEINLHGTGDHSTRNLQAEANERADLRQTQEQRIAFQFGDEYTQQQLDLAKLDFDERLQSRRMAYVNGITTYFTNSPPSADSLPPLSQPPDWRLLNGQGARPSGYEPNSGEGSYNLARNGYCFRGLSSTQREALRNATSPSDFDEEYNRRLVTESSQNENVPTVEVLQSDFLAKFEQVFSQLEILNREELTFSERIRNNIVVESLLGEETSEGQILSSLQNSYRWFYYHVYANEGYSGPVNPDNTVAGLNLWEQILLLEGAEIIARIRIRQYLLEADEELISREVDDPTADGIDDELGLYTEEGVAELQQSVIAEALEDSGGDGATQAESAQLRRLAEQAFLIDYLPELASINQSQRRPQYNNLFTMIHGQTDTIVNKLLYNQALLGLEDLTPAEMSNLVPNIRLFKVFYEIDEVGERGQPFEQEVPFESHIDPASIDLMTTSGIHRGRGVGIKKFDWRFEGQNPFTARRDIFAKLTLFFQSLDDFLRTSTLPVIGSPKLKTRDFRYVDLVNIGLRERTSNITWNPDYYRLKIEVGWATPDDDIFIGNSATREFKKKAIEKSKMVMNLTATEHEISINELGNVEVNIDYIAFQEASYFDADSDILATDEIRALRLQRRQKLLEAAEQCNTDYVAQVVREYARSIRQEKYNSYQRLMRELYENDKIFYLSVNPLEIEGYINYGSTNQGSINGFRDLFRNGNRTSALDNFDITDSTAARNGTDAIVESIGEDGLGVTDEGEEETILGRLKDLTYDTSEEVAVDVQFFYFGDLIETALRIISRYEGTQDGNQEQTGIIGKIQKKLKFLLGPISFRQYSYTGATYQNFFEQRVENLELEENNESDQDLGNLESRLVYNINLADIPISVHYFIEWFMEQSVSRDRTIYPFLTFVRDLANKLLRSVFQDQGQSFKNITRQNLQLRSNVLTARAVAGEGGASVDILESRKNIIPFAPNRFTRIDVDEAFDNRGVAPLLEAPGDGEDSYNYMLLYAINMESVQELNGDPAMDAQKGIYHLAIAKDRGILKSVSFSKTDIPGLRESRFETGILENATGLAILANVYDITVKLFGNINFVPGMKIYLDPAGLSGEIGSPSDRNSPAYVLGIGGYHTIYRVESYIESGQFETTITAVFEGTGQRPTLGFNTPNNTAEQARCDEARRAVDLLAAHRSDESGG